LNCVSFSKEGEYFAAGGKDNLVYVWQSNFKPLVRLPDRVEQELEDIGHNELTIGGALSLSEHIGNNQDHLKAMAYEKLTNTLEGIVSSVNDISNQLSSLNHRLELSERRTSQIKQILLSSSRPHPHASGALLTSISPLSPQTTEMGNPCLAEGESSSQLLQAPSFPQTLATGDLIGGLSLPSASEERSGALGGPQKSNQWQGEFQGSELVSKSIRERIQDDAQWNYPLQIQQHEHQEDEELEACGHTIEKKAGSWGGVQGIGSILGTKEMEDLVREAHYIVEKEKERQQVRFDDHQSEEFRYSNLHESNFAHNEIGNSTQTQHFTISAQYPHFEEISYTQEQYRDTNNLIEEQSQNLEEDISSKQNNLEVFGSDDDQQYHRANYTQNRKIEEVSYREEINEKESSYKNNIMGYGEMHHDKDYDSEYDDSNKWKKY